MDLFLKTQPYDQQTLCPRNHGMAWASGPHLGGGGELRSGPRVMAATPSGCLNTRVFPKDITKKTWCVFSKQSSQTQIAFSYQIFLFLNLKDFVVSFF